jgi:iron complex outermembrane receptor protein
MNINAAGTKVFQQLPYAHVLNTGIAAQAKLGGPWAARADASYRYGQGAEAIRLPLIQPLQYGAGLQFDKKGIHAEASANGSSSNRFSAELGETRKPAYAIYNLAVGKSFTMGKGKLTIDLGVDNLMDSYYTTFSDWFGIPRPGRNVFAHLVYAL